MPAARAPSLVRPPYKSVRLAVDMVMSAQGVIVPGKQQPPRMWARVNPGSAAAAEVKARRESVRIGWKHRYRRRPALPLVCRYYLHRRWIVVVWLRGPRPATELQQEALAGGVGMEHRSAQTYRSASCSSAVAATERRAFFITSNWMASGSAWVSPNH